MTRPLDVQEIDPSTVTTPQQLADRLNDLRQYAGLTFARIAEKSGKLATENGRLFERMSASTAHNYATKITSFPSRERFLAYLVACGVPKHRLGDWLAARERALPGARTAPPGAVRVREARPLRLGLRAPIAFEDARDESPAYVPRDLDDGLRQALAAAAEDGGFLLLTGLSCVGKTRTLYEAVLRVMPEWWLVHPASTDAIRELAAAPTRRTVLWLDELQGHLGTANPLTEGTVRTLLDAGTVIVGTMWASAYQARGPAPRREGHGREDEDRRLLGLARVFDVAAAFTASEHARAQELRHEDRWVRAALASPDLGFTQVLAAAPDLVRRWECAPDPYAEHVITAAVDARRLGVRKPVSEEFLRAAVRGYLKDRRGVAPRDWLRASLDYATTPLRGVAPALTPCSDGDMEVTTGYIAADYLLQRAWETRRTLCPDDAVWQALSEHCHDAEDLGRLAGAADRRMRYAQAAAFYRTLSERGDHGATEALAEALIRRGRTEEAIEVLHSAVRADWYPGRARALARWADLLAAQGRAQEAIDVLGALGEREQTIKLLARVGRLDEAVEVARRWAAEGSRRADGHLADLLAELGDEEALRARAAAGQVNSTGRLAELLARRGRRDEAIALYLPYIHSERGAADRVVDLLVEGGRVEEALAALRPFLQAGYCNAHRMLVEILHAHGREEEAVDHLRTVAARVPDLDGLEAQLCPLRELPALAATGRWPAVARWTRHIAEQGNLDQALDIVKPLADRGNIPAVEHLTQLLADHGRLPEALDLLRDLIASGGGPLAWWAPTQLSRLLFAHGRVGELRTEVDAGTEGAAKLLRRLLDGEAGAEATDRPERCRGWILPEYGVC
jgi:tetratricopeptide (TPR) repeat protein/transcriptional regulator with XRE-family HTH domain